VEFLKTEYFKPSFHYAAVSKFINKETISFRETLNIDIRKWIVIWIIIYEVFSRMINWLNYEIYMFFFNMGITSESFIINNAGILIPGPSTFMILGTLYLLIKRVNRNNIRNNQENTPVNIVYNHLLKNLSVA